MNTKLSLNAAGEFSPETTMTVTHTGSVSKSYFKGNRELDRSQVLTTIIGGSEPDNAIYTHNNAIIMFEELTDLNIFLNIIILS
ncbi:hypothetical protein [Flavobacterium suzhouense]|uniref:Uncharacterized protein n=1 Tax=Flavobacterium suzhouense TaxID=1529638 RepID=A0ABW5NUP2_9FLAO